MTNISSLDKRKNKSFVINNKSILKQYALKNSKILGPGIIVINLLLLDRENINELNLTDENLEEEQETTVHKPVSYIPQANFWFKMISLKIKKKHQIDIQEESNSDEKFFIVFIKDASIEHFSIYSITV